MTSILSARDYTRQLIAINQALNNAQGKITFWGTRVVEINDGAESLALPSLGQRISEAASKCLNTGNLTLAERVAGIELVEKLDQLYLATQAQVGDCNFFTLVLLKIRDYLAGPYCKVLNNEEHSIGYFADTYFCTYTEAHFQQQFLAPSENHPSVVQRWLTSGRVTIDAEFVRGVHRMQPVHV